MTYDEFKELQLEGRVTAAIHNRIAMQLIYCLPARYRYAHYFWGWVWMLSIPAFIGVSIFYRWWLGLLLLFFVTPIMSASLKRTAAQFVLEHAEDDREFFDELVSKNLLTFSISN